MKKFCKKFIKLTENYKRMKREKVMEAVKELPQEFDLEELIEKLLFVEKVEKGLQQIEEGKTVTHEQTREIVKKW